jgi:hypothetical protein
MRSGALSRPRRRGIPRCPDLLRRRRGLRPFRLRVRRTRRLASRRRTTSIHVVRSMQRLRLMRSMPERSGPTELEYR